MALYKDENFLTRSTYFTLWILAGAVGLVFLIPFVYGIYTAIHEANHEPPRNHEANHDPPRNQQRRLAGNRGRMRAVADIEDQWEREPLLELHTFHDNQEASSDDNPAT